MSDDIRTHLERMKRQDAEEDAARTRYVIKAGLVYVLDGKHFTDRRDDAKRFDTMTQANIYVTLNTMLDAFSYDVEPV